MLTDDDLKCEKHCSAAVSKANRILGMIKRNFTDRSKEVIIPLYKSCKTAFTVLLPNIWNPNYNKDIDLVEGVQRRATNVRS